MPSQSDEPSVVAREVRMRRDSEHTHHRSKRKKTEHDDHSHKSGEKGKKQKFSGEESRKQTKTTRPSIWRRATATADPNRTKAPLDRKEASRKDAPRPSSSRHVYEHSRRRESLSVRSEKRPTSKTVVRGAKDRLSSPRSALHHNADLSKPSSTKSASRPSLHRSKTTTRKDRPADAQASSRPEAKERAHSFSGTSKRAPSILGSVMSSSKVKPVKQVECVTCLEDIPETKSNHLKHCHHDWCDSCLKRIFDLSVTDSQHMPPKCCGNKPIQPKVAMHLYKSDFRKLWNAKYAEWTTKDRLYCPHKGCGTWIKPEYIKVDKTGKRVYGKCPKCDRKVCPKCNCKYHPDKKECPDDPETAAFIKTAKENGWQNCGKCGLTIERTEGCHHMHCPPPCNYEFCILCGARWKTCQCSWFDNDMMEAERVLALLNPGLHPRQMPGGQIRDLRQPAAPRRTYDEEIAMRREQERQDEALARRLAQMNMDGEGSDNDNDIFGPPFPDLIHGMPADYVFRARNVIADPHGMADLDDGPGLMARLRQEYVQIPGHPDGRFAPRRHIVRNGYGPHERVPRWDGQAAAPAPFRRGLVPRDPGGMLGGQRGDQW